LEGTPDPGLVSFVLPAHNERESLAVLLGEIRAAAARLGRPHEIVVVDDGSTDGSWEWLLGEAAAHGDVVARRFRSNRGQSAALAAGLEACRGAVVVTMDADLQNDPLDAVELVAALGANDLACGVRVARHDRWSKRVGSRIGNGVRSLLLGDGFRDVGCALKAWRRPVAARLPRFRGFHRFIPVLARAEGFSVVEVPVHHRGRRFGRTHYGNLRRAFHGLVDVFGVAWLRSRRIDARLDE
jgi:glycosyltransferase involved in cell wall biosynthesis